jgi:dihydropteroate synthase
MSRTAAVFRGGWRLTHGKRVTLDAPRVMGVLNLTPDSFSDGGAYATLDQALAHARELVEQGADLIDVGGESTRPGAREVSVAEELDRVLPFVREAAAQLGVPVSVDTRKARVAAAALKAGASIVNDVSGLAHDPDMAAVVAEHGAGVVLMHMRGTPYDMRTRARYDDVTAEVAKELNCGLARALDAGIDREHVVLDPGFGFAKTAEHSLALLERLDELSHLGYPLLVGPSRKSFLGHVLDVPPHERVAGTVAACVLAYERGARIFRVHDVRPVAQALAVAHAVSRAGARVVADVPGDSVDTVDGFGVGTAPTGDARP